MSSSAKADDPVNTGFSMERCYWVYILASRIGGTLYIGVTNDLVRRVHEHKGKTIRGLPQNTESAGWFILSNLTASKSPLFGKSVSRNGIGSGRFN